jgi:CAAX prenyl protease-like protein
MGSILLGTAVFAVWIGPDVLWAGYRDHWLFQNAITGELTSSLPDSMRIDMMVLLCRTIRAAVLVPVIEELFWRGWLMRWLIDDDFEKVPLGAYTTRAFWITALLFASEHGPYWEVGLLAGVAYNWWIIRSKRLGDCIVAHAVTNALLSAYVIAAGKWEYWM